MSWKIEGGKGKKGIMRSYFFVVTQLYTLLNCLEELLSERGDHSKNYRKMWTIGSDISLSFKFYDTDFQWSTEKLSKAPHGRLVDRASLQRVNSSPNNWMVELTTCLKSLCHSWEILDSKEGRIYFSNCKWKSI